MAGDLTGYLQKVPIDDPQFKTGLAFQTYQRSLNEAAIFKEGPNGELQTLAVAAGNYGVNIDARRIKSAIAQLKGLPSNATVDAATPDRVSVLTPLLPGTKTYLYVGRFDPEIAAQIRRANVVLHDYHTF